MLVFFGVGAFWKCVANGDDAVEVVEEDVGEFGVEVLSAFLFEEFEDSFESPGFFVEAFNAECVEYVCDTGDSSVDVDVLTFESLWISFAVKFFVVLVGDECGGLEDGAAGCLEHVVSHG